MLKVGDRVVLVEECEGEGLGKPRKGDRGTVSDVDSVTGGIIIEWDRVDYYMPIWEERGEIKKITTEDYYEIIWECINKTQSSWSLELNNDDTGKSVVKYYRMEGNLFLSKSVLSGRKTLDCTKNMDNRYEVCRLLEKFCKKDNEVNFTIFENITYLENSHYMYLLSAIRKGMEEGIKNLNLGKVL